MSINDTARLAMFIGAARSPPREVLYGAPIVVSRTGYIADAWLTGFPDEFEILIWHHDSFTLPAGAVPLYSSKFCADQAFVLGNTLATVAHIEVTAPLLREWVTIYGDDIHPESPSVQRPEQILHRLDERVRLMHANVTDRLYTTWLSRIREAERHWERGSELVDALQKTTFTTTN
jgi:hypothetical protein